VGGESDWANMPGGPRVRGALWKGVSEERGVVLMWAARGEVRWRRARRGGRVERRVAARPSCAEG
jgi:hypothetical protein